MNAWWHNKYSRFVVSILCAVVLLFGISKSVDARPAIKNEFPRLANYYLSWTMSQEEADELSQWDVLVLDMEVARRNPESLRRLREKNPNIVLLAYITPAEIRTDLGSLGSSAPLRNSLAARIPDAWYLKNAEGERRTFWPGTNILNVSDMAPMVDGKQWSDVLVDFVRDEIMASGFWDGVFYDNAWENITYFAHGSVDLNADGVNETNAHADELWRQGMATLYRKTRAALPNAYVFANDGPMYAKEVDGVMVEDFPKDPWRIMASKLQKIRIESKEKAPILNAISHGGPTDYAAMRYGLTTALSYSSFYSFDNADVGHTQRWWYDEYSTFLGAPRALPVTLPSGLVRRDFDQGIVLVNPTSAPLRNRFIEDFEKIIGVQDRSINDGAIVSDVTVGSHDGIILHRRISEVSDVPYENGSFARVFTASGVVERAGFFALNKNFDDGVVTALADLDGDGTLERITMRGQTLSVNTRSIQPFGTAFRGQLTMSIADIDNDGRKEIVVAAASQGTGEVRVYRSSLALSTLPFLAFGPTYHGGISVAAGDVMGDGKTEIIVGAGVGGGPEVRIFSTAGKLLRPGFFAYDPRFRGGVRVATGKLFPGQLASIVTGAGVGGGPQVRVFDAMGRASTSFFAFDRARRSGVTPVVADVNGDGVNEILAFTRDFSVP